MRALLLGILHRTIGEYAVGRQFLAEAHRLQVHGGVKVSTWVGGVAMFEMAVLDLKEAERELDATRATDETGSVEVKVEVEGRPKLEIDDEVERRRRDRWTKVLRGANEKLDKALALATQQVDLSSRLDSRIAMLRDEIATKKDMLAAEAKV